ncbi:MAG: tyrosine-type recombinase/integrase [Burkholderiales bacterium]|nr:tyrosine-type recombinase/integrase [Burkholderiales bacterium]
MAAQDALTEEQLEALLGAVSTRGVTGRRNLALLTLMADSGLRLAEALALTTLDLVREGKVITQARVRCGKGGKRADVTVTARAAARLDRWLADRQAAGLCAGPVFCTMSQGRATGYAEGSQLAPGVALNPRYIRDVVARAAERAGIATRVTPHTLRHTFATHLLRQTGNLELVRKAMRHARVTTTAAIYSHLVGRDVEEAVRALRAPGLAAAPETPLDPMAAFVATLSPEQRAAFAAALAAG